MLNDVEQHSLKGYNRLGEEILTELNGKVDAFVASVGTAGCAMGVAEGLKAKNPQTKAFIVEPSESPVILTDDPVDHIME